MRYVRFAVACAIAASSVSGQARADVTVEGQTIAIHGQINTKDVASVSAAISDPKVRWQSPMENYIVWLDSPGGDIDAAMAIGRMLRKAGAATTLGSLAWVKATHSRGLIHEGDMVPKPAICASACVLIFCAGVHRIPGKLGIHRLYSTGVAKGSDSDIWARYGAAASRVKVYLEEMGIPSRLYEEMMRVPAHKMRWLTSVEQEEWGLLDDDPAWVDARESRNAAGWGLSKEEYFRRSARADQECSRPYPTPYQKGQKGAEEWKNYKRASAASDACVRAVFRGDR